MRDGGHKASGRQLAAQAAPPRMVVHSTYAEGVIPDRYRGCHPDPDPDPDSCPDPDPDPDSIGARLLGDEPEQELGELGAARGQQRAVDGAAPSSAVHAGRSCPAAQRWARCWNVSSISEPSVSATSGSSLDACAGARLLIPETGLGPTLWHSLHIGRGRRSALPVFRPVNGPPFSGEGWINCTSNA